MKELLELSYFSSFPLFLLAVDAFPVHLQLKGDLRSVWKRWESGLPLRCWLLCDVEYKQVDCSKNGRRVEPESWMLQFQLRISRLKLFEWFQLTFFPEG